MAHRLTCRADRGIHQLSGLTQTEVQGLLERAVGKPSRECRSIRRECRMWLRRNVKVESKPRVAAHLISMQDGLTTEKLIVATI